MNRYAYVEGAPESFVDVLGFFRAAAAIQAQKLAALNAAFEAAFADLNRVVASQARLPGAWTVKQMMASYNMFHASDDPVVRAAMDQIAREAFYGVTQQRYQAKVQVAFQEQAAKAQAQAQARYVVATAAQAAVRVQDAAKAQADAAAVAKENRPWYEKSLSIFGDTAKTYASDAWDLAVSSVEYTQLGEIIKFVAAPDYYFVEKKEVLSASWENAQWAATHPVEACVFVNVELPKLVVESVWGPIRDCWNAGDYGCAVGHALFDVTLFASMFADGVGIPAAVAKVETSLIETEAALARAAEAARAAELAEIARAENAVVTAEAASVKNATVTGGLEVAAAAESTSTGVARPWQLTPTERLSGNASATNVRALAESMRQGGWQGDPIKVVEIGGERIIVDGHHRVAAARLAGIEVPYQVVDPATVIGPGQWSSIADILDDAANAGGRA